MKNREMETSSFDPESDREKFARIKEEFLKPFSSEEIQDGWNQVLHTSEVPIQTDLLHRSFDGFDYVIHLMQEHNYRIEFQITGPETETLAKLVFVRDKPEQNSWFINHRLINTGDLHISGTEFLQQAEEYMQEAAKHGYIELHIVDTDVSQEQVTKWFLKNGYKFQGGEHLFKRYQQYPEQFEKIYITDTELGLRNEAFLFEKSEINEDEINKYRSGDPESPLREITIPHQDMLRLSGLVRFHLGKTFDGTEVAKSE